MSDKPVPYEKAKNKDWVAQKPGAPTARYTKLIKVPVKLLMTIPGLRGEHEVLHPKMEKVKVFVDLVKDIKWQRDHPIEVEVHHNGSMFIGDGNHRKLAADIAHLDTYLCKVTFYGGSEDEINFENVMNKYAAMEQSMNIKKLINQASAKIAAGEDISDITATLCKLADDQAIGGATNLDGAPGDQQYSKWRETGEDLTGENDPSKGDQRRTGPREPNDMVQEASSNKPCVKCGMPTDQCQCMDDKMPNNGKNPSKTTPKVDPRMDAYKQAELKIKAALIAHSNMNRLASHMEEIEIPFSDLNLEDGVDYKMSGPGAQQQVSMLVQRYLKMHVYPGRSGSFTIARLEQSDNKVFVKILVFDNQINHEGSDATKSDRLHKLSNVDSENLTKTAWKKRLTESLGANDKTGLVSCPLESHILTRSCHICPLAGNPETYIVEGSVNCHFDDMNLSDNRRSHTSDVNEHQPWQR